MVVPDAVETDKYGAIGSTIPVSIILHSHSLMV